MFFAQAKYQERPLVFYLLLFLILLEGAFFTFYGISRHYNYLTSINDLGCFDQAIWGTINGAPFLNTIVFSKPINWIGFHFHPVLLLFVPFYMIFPDVIWLILAQAVALPLAALPIYYLARHVTEDELTAFYWALVYLFTPFMLSTASWDFHPVALAVPFVALACLAVEQGRFRLLLFSCLFILLCKEHLGMMVTGFGLLWLIRRRQLGPSLVLMLIGVGHFLLVFKLVMPAYSPMGVHVMLVEGLEHLSRYSWLGSSFSEIFTTIMTRPLETGQHVLVAMKGWIYLALLLIPLLGLPLLGCEFLLPLMGDLMANLLSATSMPRSVFAYHSVTLIPILIAAAITGSYRLKCLFKIVKPELQAFMALCVTFIFGWVFFPFFSIPGSIHFWEPKRVFALHDESYNLVKDLVSDDMSLTVQSNIGAHFSQRYEVYTYPNNLHEVDAVILKLDSPTTFLQTNNPGSVGSLAHHLQMQPRPYLESVRDLLHQDIYPRVVWMDPWLILMKGEKRSFAYADILRKISELEKEWHPHGEFLGPVQ